jgi:hypothetical protein
MKNGLYSVHIQMGDGVRGRASGVIVLRDGAILGGDPYFWSVGSYTVGNGTWKGDLITNQHTPSITTAWRARSLPAGRLPRAFQVHFGMSARRFSAPRWWAQEASVFARLYAG